MYVTEGRGGGLNATLKKKHREQDYAISNQHWVCKFEEMGWDMFLKNNWEIIVLRGWRRVATLLKMGLRGICWYAIS